MRLSNKLTFFWKFIFTGIWLTTFLSIVVQAVFDWLSGAEAESQMKNVTAIVFFGLATAFAVWMLGSLKSVQLDGDVLTISNYFRTIRVPVSEVELVNDPDITSHRRISTMLSSDTVFGKNIMFMPAFFGAQSTANLLRDKVEVSELAKKA